MRVESVLGRGTTFELYLPIARDQEPAISKEPPVAAPRLFMSGRVLLVEDLAPLREVLAKHLRHAGLEVIAATMEADGVRGSLRHPVAARVQRLEQFVPSEESSERLILSPLRFLELYTFEPALMRIALRGAVVALFGSNAVGL